VLPIAAWRSLEFYLQPNSTEQPGSGVVIRWVEGALVLDWRGDWGCNVTGTDAHNGSSAR
jgi:hypothetical protein